MNFSNLTDEQLEKELKVAVSEETKSQLRVLHLLAEAEKRRLYSKTLPSLFEYCIRVLKYSGGSAQRRIDTMRAMKLIPEIENKLKTGELNLMSVSQAQTFFRHEAKAGKKYSVEEKKEVLSQLENKSAKDCVETLIGISPNAIPREKRRELTPEKTELKTVLSKEIIEKLNQIKALLSHRNPNMTDGELIEYMANQVLKALIPKKSDSLPPVEVRSENPRYVPAKLKGFVWHRANGQCTHPGCGSKYFLEVHHIIAVGKGGQTTADNLTLLCKTHNLAAAYRDFGTEKMAQYLL